ncbi:MAG TPA: redox-sensing transcriptional repressor Rex [Candidatus Avimonoglobus intestinipullorum]|uniref:Redox-sensing transcriptional repressor Rex n=1 Tax=Candidatus Avimonoglobus intestinipullorum TaxID=2840699 RepID=A0A9D1LTS8_9FIRM|nr:redox-sensing transcriptional repressor Rex [Candidatus Avimonoglobus intestinipullorum]
MVHYNGKKVPSVVIKRLPRYYRYLGELLKQDIKRISSNVLSTKMNVTASQIRQDFNYFGGFGQQGYGYNVEFLYREIGEILGLHEGYKTIIVGAGHLGHALANHSTFEKRGFRLAGIFDIDETIIGKEINGVKIMHIDTLEEFIAQNGIDIAILATPRAVVQDMANRLVACGIKGLWNFSYVELKTDQPVAIENVHLSDSLMTLSYKIKQGDEE